MELRHNLITPIKFHCNDVAAGLLDPELQIWAQVELFFFFWGGGNFIKLTLKL